MRIVICSNGHMYDADVHASCPYCETWPPAGYRFEETDRTWQERTDVSYARPPRPAPVTLVPSRLPKPWEDCHVTDRLGSGGTGTVFRIRRTVDYALKVVPWRAAGARETALREYETARKLGDCGHILQYLDYREADSSSMLIQELAVPWMQHARQHRCTVGEALDAVLQLCEALTAMSAAGILHMDVNPKNIFIKDGVVKLGDFSHAVSAQPGKEYDGLVGTRPFMAPEIVYGGVCSGKEDLYSLGITMFLLLTGGRFPFDFAGREPPVRRASDRITTVFLDGELKRIVEKAAAYAPEDRYESAEAMACDVAAFMSAHLDVLTEPVPRPRTAVPRDGADWEDAVTEPTVGSTPTWLESAPSLPTGKSFVDDGTERPLDSFDDDRSVIAPPRTTEPSVRLPFGAPEALQPPAKGIFPEDVRSALLSYAREDMPAAARVLQALRKAGPDLDICFDREKLRGGELREERLRSEMRSRDRLILCWSRSAARSERVRMEWSCMALEKGLGAIEIIYLESPEECPLPEELKGCRAGDLEALIRDPAVSGK